MLDVDIYCLLIEEISGNRQLRYKLEIYLIQFTRSFNVIVQCYAHRVLSETAKFHADNISAAIEIGASIFPFDRGDASVILRDARRPS